MRWAFGEFELDGAGFELFRAGQRVTLQRKPLQVLIHLVRNATRTVPSAELLREVWPDVTVTEGSVRRAVKVLRAALGGPVDGFIESRHGYGYRFAAALSTAQPATNEIAFLMWQPYDRGFGSTEFRNPEELVRVQYGADEEVIAEGGAAALPSRPVEALDTSSATPVKIQLTESKDADGNTVLGIDGVPFSEAQPYPAFIGETQVWTIENTMHSTDSSTVVHSPFRNRARSKLS